jgi:hypothetical protein
MPRHFVRVTGIADELVLKDLPFRLARVHVDTLWARRLQHDGAHQWLRQTVALAAHQAFDSLKLTAAEA